jgi:hypothetical protein
LHHCWRDMHWEVAAKGTDLQTYLTLQLHTWRWMGRCLPETTKETT